MEPVHAEVFAMRIVRTAMAAGIIAAMAAVLVCGDPATADDQPAGGFWELAKAKQDIHRFSTLFTAQDVRDQLSSDERHRRRHRLVPQDGRDQGLHRSLPRRLPGQARGPCSMPSSGSRRRVSRSPAASPRPTSASVPPAGTASPATPTRPPRSGSSESSSTPPGCSTRS